MNEFIKNQANKILDCYSVDVDLIKGGKRYEMVRVVRDGKVFYQNRLVGSDVKPKEDLSVGGYIRDEGSGLEVKRYSDDEFSISGDIYENLDLLSDIKNNLGIGKWDKKINAIVLPYSKKNEVFSILATKIKVDTYDESVEKDNVVAIKNSIPIGSTIVVDGKNVVVTGINADKGVIEYEYDDGGGKEEKPAEEKKTGKRGRKEVPVGTMSKDGRFIKTADGWEYIKKKNRESEVGIPETTDPKKVSDIINDANPENRFEKGKELFGKAEGLASDSENIKDEVVDFKAKNIEVKTPSGKTVTAIDYFDYPQKNIQILNQDEVGVVEKPDWALDFNEKKLITKEFQFDYIQLDDSKILLAIGGGFEMKNDGSYTPSDDNKYVIVSLDQLVAIQDYYIKLAKFNQDKRKEEEIKENVEKIRNMSDGDIIRYSAFSYNRLSAAQKKKYTPEEWGALSKEEKLSEVPKMTKPLYSLSRSAKQKVGVLPSDTMLISNFRMYKFLIDNEYRVPYRTYEPNDPAVLLYEEIRDALKWKRADMSLQREENDNSYSKGMETSWGDKNTQDNLLNNLGVKIKTQDGSEMTPDKVSDIEKALADIYETFGDRSALARKNNLKISHSGEKLMFARKALGIYVPSMNAIGVSNSSKHGKFGFTLAHEFAHFIDNKLGQAKGRNYASDDYNSLAGKIATAFRRNMNEAPRSAYYGRTCECFARALEQYHATKDNADQIKTLADNVPYNKSPEHVSQEKFDTIIKPLIDQFFKENDNLLKSILSDINVISAGELHTLNQAKKILNCYR